MKRQKLSRSKSRKSFTRSADLTHRKNFSSSGAQYTMRGGIRL